MSRVAEDQSNGLVQVLGEISESLKRNSVYLDAATRVPLYNEESKYDTSGSITILTVPPKTSNYFLVRQVVYSIPTAATGVLSIGGVTLPVPGGSQSLNWYQLIGPASLRQLTSSIAGALSLSLMGDIVSRRMNYR